ncbi:membrane protein [Caballeronia sordidicola]|uniref:Membrane protein n=1 Tax=Caballeronia sordidicola TaxID=196367 RepID=A0A158FFP8_CABSO|nr:DUF969 domain-containing protein [Caballeronia sordidicola]SAL18678.1 membrane protein [Caballeronia sordidicola]
MSTPVDYWPLIGVVVVALGFVCRFNPMLVVTFGAVATGFAAKMSPHDILAQLGTGFIKARNLPLITLLPLPVIGLLERHGLREFVQRAIVRIRAATAGRLLVLYLFVRELSAALGLVSLGGHAQMVRPLIAPMAEGLAEERHGDIGDARYRVRAFAASADNIGLFFGEDVFVAFGVVLFMENFLRGAGIEVSPLHIAVAGIPTAVLVFFFHSFRLYRLDNWLSNHNSKQLGVSSAPATDKAAPAQTLGDNRS